MPGFATEVTHGLGKDEALQRLKAFVEQMRQQYGAEVATVQGQWNDNVLDFSLRTFGLTITGNLTVGDALARVAGHLPLAALPFRGKIERSIASQLQQALA